MSDSFVAIADRAIYLAKAGEFGRAQLLLRRAVERVSTRFGVYPLEAVNLLVLSDLIGAPECRDAQGGLRGYGPMPGVPKL